MCSEPSLETLSKDLGQKDFVQNVENSSHDDNTSMLQSTCDFEFVVGSSLEHESFSADELFSNGVIVPTQAREGLFLPQYVKRHHPKVPVASPLPRPPILYPSPAEISKKASNEGIVSSSKVEDKPKSNTSGWFSRSSSLKGETKKSILSSLSLLPRSNSVGSVPNQKKAMSKDKQNSQRRSSFSLTKSFSYSSTSSSSSNHASSQKPPSKKNHVMKYGNGVQTSPSPVLNMPSSSIGIGASNLFGFSRLLPGRKDQKNCRSGSIIT